MTRINENRYISWDKDSERLLLYADIMGFKDRTFRCSHEQLKKDFSSFRKKWDRQIKPLFDNTDYLKFVQFSDSFLIMAKGVDGKMFNLISKAAVRLMQVALEMGFPIKGVLAQGIFTFSSDMQLYFGRPLVDAAVLHDQLKFYGIAVHHSAEKTVKEFMSVDNPYFNSKIAIKTGKVSHYHLAWHLLNTLLDSSDNSKQCEKWLSMIAEGVSGEPRIYIDNTLDIIHQDKLEDHGGDAGVVFP